MFQYGETAAALTGFTPSEEDRRSLEEWFAAYDAYSSRPTGENIGHMADMAVFPLNLVTDGSDGDAWTGQWDREEFTSTMSAVMGGEGSEEVTFDSVRTPFFLTARLAVVFTTATTTTGDGGTHRMAYADVLVREGGTWAFQTMIQGGWADMLKGREGEGR